MNQDISPPTTNQTPNAPQGFGGSPAPTPETPAPQAPQAPVGQVIPLQSGPKKSKLKAVVLALLFLLLLGAVAGAYLYQQGKIDTISTAKIASDRQVVELMTQLKTATATKAPVATTPAAANYDVVTGVVTAQATGTATLNTLFKQSSVDEVWVEYGTAPDALTSATKHVASKELAAAAANAYGQQSFTVTGLKSSQNYFYRVAAKGKTTTIYGGVVSFTSVK